MAVTLQLPKTRQKEGEGIVVTHRRLKYGSTGKEFLGISSDIKFVSQFKWIASRDFKYVILCLKNN